jgi:hypothetical protein
VKLTTQLHFSTHFPGVVLDQLGTGTIANDYDGRSTHNRTPAPARTFKAATTNKPNTTKRNHVQTKDTQIELMVNHITKITRGNYNRKKENRIRVSSGILNH